MKLSRYLNLHVYIPADRDREKKRAAGLALLILGFLVSNQEAAKQMEAFGLRSFETLAKGLALSSRGREIKDWGRR